MDGIWDFSYYEQAIEQGSDHVGNEWECDFDFRFKPDVIEEDALNEKCCVQALKLLLTKADSETVELQEELIMLQSQLAWLDEDWSKLCSSILQEKIDCLEILIHALKTNEKQDHELGDDDLQIYREPAEKIHDILQALLEQRLQQTDSQLVGFVANHFNLDLSGAETSSINLYSRISKKKGAKDPSLTPEVKFVAQKSSLETQVEEESNLETVIFLTEDTSLKSKPVASKKSIADANENLQKGKQLIADPHTTGTLEKGIEPFTTNEELQLSQDQPKIESLEKQCHTDKLGSNSFSEGSKRSGNSEMSVKYISTSVSPNVKTGKKKATGDHVTSNVNLKLVYKKRKRSPVLEGTKRSKCDEISVPELSDGARKAHPVYPVFEGTMKLKGVETKSEKNYADWVDITTRTDVQIMECLNGSYVESLKSLSCSTGPHSILSISELKKKKLKELHQIAKDYDIKGFSKLNKEELAKLVYSYMGGEKKAKGKRQCSSQ